MRERTNCAPGLPKQANREPAACQPIARKYDMRMIRHCRWLTLAVLICPALQAQDAARPNMLVLCAGDLAGGSTGFGGNSGIRTRHLDRLASEGVHFTRCYTPTPQDGPGRVTILTGQYPHTHRVNTDGLMLSPNADSSLVRLKKAGYACGLIGNWHLAPHTGGGPASQPAEFTALPADSWTWKGSEVLVTGERSRTDQYLTDWEADQVIHFLEKSQEHPFVLFAGFTAPRMPLEYPPGGESQYPLDQVQLPHALPTETVQALQATFAAFAPVRNCPQDETGLREARSKYAAMVGRLDENIGRILDRLEALGLKSRTLILFTAGSGMAVGDYKLLGKGPLFCDPLVRVPLILRHPAMGEPGSQIDRIVGLVDLAPTLLEATGLSAPITQQGRSLLPLLRQPSTRGHADERFFEYEELDKVKFPARGIVTTQYKFIDYQGPGDMLFDLKRDPNETRNVATDPAYAEIVHVLKERLNTWRRTTRDPSNWN